MTKRQGKPALGNASVGYRQLEIDLDSFDSCLGSVGSHSTVAGSVSFKSGIVSRQESGVST